MDLLILFFEPLNYEFDFYTFACIGLSVIVIHRPTFLRFSLDEFELPPIILDKIRMLVEVVVLLGFYFLESVYIKLANKGGKIAVLKIFLQYMLRKLIAVRDHENARGSPLHAFVVLRVLE